MPSGRADQAGQARSRRRWPTRSLPYTQGDIVPVRILSVVPDTGAAANDKQQQGPEAKMVVLLLWI